MAWIHWIHMAIGREWRHLDLLSEELLAKGSPVRQEGAVISRDPETFKRGRSLNGGTFSEKEFDEWSGNVSPGDRERLKY